MSAHGTRPAPPAPSTSVNPAVNGSLPLSGISALSNGARCAPAVPAQNTAPTHSIQNEVDIDADE